MLLWLAAISHRTPITGKILKRALAGETLKIKKIFRADKNRQNAQVRSRYVRLSDPQTIKSRSTDCCRDANSIIPLRITSRLEDMRCWIPTVTSAMHTPPPEQGVLLHGSIGKVVAMAIPDYETIMLPLLEFAA
ncbi:hypothetical protein, partial [Methanothrix sp.]|uniref:hypothetical protein n=1 Tax=Methanothrix sp. TaxID=90426 RepID=UPI0034E2F7A2